MRFNPLLLSLLLLSPIAAVADEPDLVLGVREATPLTEANIGSPYWALQAQCAGMFGAGHAWSSARGDANSAETEKNAGAAMLTNALVRLQTDRGLDRPAAIELVKPEVESGRARAKRMLNLDGDDSGSVWNTARSTCLDIADGHRMRVARSG